MQIDLSQFFDIFFEEAEEHLATLESVLLALDIDAPDAEALNAIFRAAHSIKGGAGTFGFTDLINVTHQLETLLDAVRKHTLQLTPSHIDTILAATDALRDILNNCRQGVATDPVLIQEMEARLRAELLPKDVSSAAIPVLQEEARTHHFSIATDGQLAWEALLQRLTAEPRAKITGFPVEPDAKDPLCIEFLGTDSEFADLCDSLAFVVPPSAIRLEHAPPPLVDDANSWGLFHEETPAVSVPPSVLDDEDGWGLFEDDAPSTPPVVPSPVPVTEMEEDDGWGLFEAVPTRSTTSNTTPPVTLSETTEDDEGFGFFTPVPQPPSATSLATAMAEEGDGFGLFVPVPLAPPVAPPVPVVSAPQVVAPTAPRTTVPTPTRQGNNAESATIRVNVEKVDQLLDLVGELVITQSMLAQCAAQLEQQGVGNDILLAGIKQLERNTRDLQESVMSVRMMPIASVFNRFPRLVRDLAGKLGKQVELHLEGESTELDKAFIEKLADPMTHLVRNSLDHGIESPEKRRLSGKSPIGHLTLRASHQGGNIVIEIRDDGAGLNRERILAKAIERGLPVHEGMPDTEVWNLIFEAGFSTAAEVSDISGRGVGMDVVRRNIQEMGGSIMIESVAGVGSTITLRLPLTLAILDGMSIRVNGEVYVLPLTCIIESLQAQPSQYKTLAKQGEVLQVRGQYLPLIRLADIFLTQTEHPTGSASLQQGLCMIVEAEKEMVALQVDELLGQQQVVIKNLETNYRRVSGISGATIMGDGRVALILDVPAVVRMAKNRSRA